MIEDNFWPPEEAFLDISGVKQLTDGRARCTGVALCDEEGSPSKIFNQGKEAHFFYEFEMLGDTGVPAGGLEFHDAAGTIIHGKNTFQYETSAPDAATRGTRLRYHHSIKLDVAAGEYWYTVGLASSDKASFDSYIEGSLSHIDFSPLVSELCRVTDVGSFEVKFAKDGKLTHHGIANLPSRMFSSVSETPHPGWLKPLISKEAEHVIPTVVHITHWKAGSQWIFKILSACAPDLIVPPRSDQVQFKFWPIQHGKIYPTVYVPKDQFDSVRLPENSRRFVIIRDLRDTLISSYFSFKISHPVMEAGFVRLRSVLNSVDFDDGLLYLMDDFLTYSARIQLSWQEAGEKLIRYEDLLEHDLEILEPLLIDECQLPVSREKFREAVIANRFENLTKGRKPGKEELTAHERKGIAGDWKNHFSEKVKRAFKSRFGGLLVATGYEKDLNW
jgi:lipopolysaccharide transport system ATP-binding protein